jgi:hypothetical protein
MRKNGYTPLEKNTIKEAMEQAYRELDDTIKDWVFYKDNPNPVDIYGLRNFINIFIEQSSKKGLFFTLNQDLFLERQFQYKFPGSPSFHQNFYNPRSRIERINYVSIPSNCDINKVKSDISRYSSSIYIKLHGSYGWLSSKGDNIMAIGINKLEYINQEPLLKCYFELFQNAIREGSKKLLIIGYGFRDDHINDVLLEGIKNYALRLYIINPTKLIDLRNNLNNAALDELWLKVERYDAYSLKQIFPPDQSKTTILQEIEKALAS